MNTWTIPGKTFLLGEYIALLGGPAVVLTTAPCFEVVVLQGLPEDSVIHPESPAGRWWLNQSMLDHHLAWRDPYHALGGLGASSAQFLGAYLASCSVSNTQPSFQSLLEAYYQSAWSGEGVRPSAYDLMAQTQWGCVSIHDQTNTVKSYDWVFEELAFILIHTGFKLNTHEHLKQLDLSAESMRPLFKIADLACSAFELADSEQIISVVNDYQTHLTQRHWTAQHSLNGLDYLVQDPKVLAAKGCGALGSDILLVIIERDHLLEMRERFALKGYNIVADSRDLYCGPSLIKNNL